MGRKWKDGGTMTQEMAENKDYKGFGDRGWICDTCHKPIVKAGDGVVEYYAAEYDNDGKKPARDIHLVHHLTESPRGTKREQGCYWPDDVAKDNMTTECMTLSDCLGPDGLMEMLQLMHETYLPLGDVIEMTKRLQIPGYEHARHHFADAIDEGVFEPNQPAGFYRQDDINEVLKWMKLQTK
jgi:hypothetical protein